MLVEGVGHNKALQISVKCMDHVLSRVVDNGPSLNVMPKTISVKLPSDESYMNPSTMVVCTFNGSRREVIGEISLPIQIGPITFEVVFHVMDIAPTYSCLLRRPWINDARAVLSALHQKLKFIVDDKLIIIFVKEDLLVNKPSSIPYIEVFEESLETSFQGLEIANSNCVKEGKAITQPSGASMMVAKVMLENGYQYGHGLGRHRHGPTQVLDLVENKDRFGLGYKPLEANKRQAMLEKKKEDWPDWKTESLELRGSSSAIYKRAFGVLGSYCRERHF